MNKKKGILLLLVVFSFFVSYAQNTAKSVQEQGFGKIRAEMVKEACVKFGYTNQDVIKKITNQSINNFYNSLPDDSATAPKVKWLRDAVGNLSLNNGLIGGTNVQNDKKSIESYLSQIQQCCKEHKNEGIDTLDGATYRKKIKKLADECICYRSCENKQDFNEYHQKYPNGLFSTLITHVETTTTEQTTVETSSQTVEAETTTSHSGSNDNQGETGPENSINNGDETSGPFSLKQVLLIVILGTVIGGAIVVGCVACYRYLQKKKKQMKETTKSFENQEQESRTIINDSEIDTKELTSNPQNSEPTSTSKQEPNQIQDPKPVSTNLTQKSENVQWVLVGASVRGNSHVQMGLPCQDCHKYESFGNGWGIAIVSDGAGSAKHSDMGSKVVVERGIVHFKQLLAQEEWMQSNVLPTDVEWLQKSYNTLKSIRNDVVMVAQKNNVAVKDLSATCLVVIFSPIGLLTVHVGDGRMGYENLSGEWKPIMTPHKGEEANQTIFLVSDFWTIPNFTLSGVLVPESVVVREQVKAFTLMSDGCENTSWLCTAKNEETGKYYDRNKPFDGFFNPLKETVISLSVSNVPEEERNEKWHNFIESGTDGFRKEQDDKTMIYGVNLSIEKNA